MNYTNEPVTGHQGTILRALHSGPKSTQDLVDALYGADPEGGPVNAITNVRVHIFYLKRKLIPGWAIDYEPGTYRLVRR